MLESAPAGPIEPAAAAATAAVVVCIRIATRTGSELLVSVHAMIAVAVRSSIVAVLSVLVATVGGSKTIRVRKATNLRHAEVDAVVLTRRASIVAVILLELLP